MTILIYDSDYKDAPFELIDFKNQIYSFFDGNEVKKYNNFNWYKDYENTQRKVLTYD